MNDISAERVGSAVVAGHICLDIIPDLKPHGADRFVTMFRPGHLVEVGPVVIATGGPVSNTGLALHTLGVPTRLMGKVGDDLFGQAVLNLVRAFGPHLADGMVVDERSSTSYSLIISLPGVDRMFLHHPGANDTFGADDVRYEQLAQADVFHFGYPPIMRRMYADGGAELSDIFARAKATGVTTSLDMAMPDPASASGRADWRAILQATLPNVDIFQPSVEELLFMIRRDAFERAQQAGGMQALIDAVTPELLAAVGDELIDMGAKMLAIKMGDRGLYLRTGSRQALMGMGRAAPADPEMWSGLELWSPCFAAEVVGTTGSGDATIAGFLSGLLRGCSPHEAVTAAVAVGACNVEAADALSGLRSWPATMARIGQGWPRCWISLSARGWRFDPELSLWVGPRRS